VEVGHVVQSHASVSPLKEPGAKDLRIVEDLPFSLDIDLYLEDSMQFKTSLMVGVLWPVNVFKSVEKKDVPKATVNAAKTVSAIEIGEMSP